MNNDIDNKIKELELKKVEYREKIIDGYFKGEKRNYALIGIAFVLAGISTNMAYEGSFDKLSPELLSSLVMTLFGVGIQHKAKLTDDEKTNIKLLKKEKEYCEKELKILNSIKEKMIKESYRR